MFFSELPKKIQKEIYLLTKDEQFQQRFATDKVLDDIDQMKYDKGIAFRQSIQLLFKKDIFNDIQLKSLTLGKISLLWYMENDYFTGKKYLYQADEMATDQFFYVIQTPFQQLNIYKIPQMAYKYVENVLKIDYETAKILAVLLIKIAFSPLKKFQTPNIKGKIQVFYDSFWATSLAVIVHNTTGFDTDYIIQKMPVSEVCLYYIAWKKMNGGNDVIQRTEEQILILQDQRASMLIVEYLIQKGKIKQEQKQHYYTLITTDPSKMCK